LAALDNLIQNIGPDERLVDHVRLVEVLVHFFEDLVSQNEVTANKLIVVLF
jgi:hypothetical protein